MDNTTYTCTCAACAAAFKLAGSTGAALPPAPANPVVVNAYTGDYRVDTLLQDLQFRWNNGSALGTSANVTFSFMTAKPTYGGTDSGTDTGFTAFTTQQKDAARAIFAKLGAQIGIKFTEVADTATDYGQIRMGNNTQAASAGYAYMPNSTGDAKDGDIWLDQSVATNLTDLAPGTAAYATLVHEIGHAIGLKHPGNYNAGEASVANATGNFLGALEDNTAYTIMSYRDAPGASGVQRDWFGTYDLLTLRTLYGAGAGSSDASTYTYTDSAGASMTTLLDTGGTDTLNISAVTVASTVDLRAGAFSSIGKNAAGAAASNNFSIDLATTIENFVGSSQNDVVIGNAANNRLTLGGGTNTADGKEGIDTAVYTGASTAYQYTSSNGTVRVTGTGSTDTLTNVERLAFTDKSIALDANGTSAAKIIGAVFGKAAVSNMSYEGTGIGLLDGGMSYANLAKLAIDARLGAGASNDAIVTLLYTNLTGAAPGAAELAVYTTLLQTNQITVGGLGALAADHVLNTTGIGLTGLATTGVAFTA